MTFLEQLQSTHGTQVAEQLTSRFGLDPETAAAVLPRMAPFVLGGVQAQMQHAGDADAAHGVLNTHGDERAVEDVQGHFDRAEQAPASRAHDLLGGLFGNQAPQAHAAMANQLGVSPDMISKILPIIAPLILGAVMNKMKGRNSTGQAATGGGGGGMDILGSILGQQGGGGNILGSVLGSVLGGGGAQGGLAQKAGCLSNILGGLLGGKK